MESPSKINNDLCAGPLNEYLQGIEAFLDDENNTEICINKPGEVLVENIKGWQSHDVPRIDYAWCRQLATLIASYSNQSLNEGNPILSATLPNGERIQVAIPPAIRSGTVSMTIRRPSNIKLTLDDYENAGAFDACSEFTGEPLEYEKNLIELKDQGRIREFLELAVLSRQNIIVSGSTGSGKTTLMKSLIDLVPNDERLLSIENVDELRLHETHPNSVSMFYTAGGQGVSQITQQHLLESALRMKPDRVFLAELIRGDEAFYYLRNVNSGHPGSITSMHANSARLAIEQLVLFLKESSSGSTMSREDIKQLLIMCVDIIVQMKVIGRKRMVTEIYYDPIFKREKMA